MQRAAENSEGRKEQVSVRQEVRTNNPRPGRNEKFSLRREEQWQMTGEDLKMSCEKGTKGPQEWEVTLST